MCWWEEEGEGALMEAELPLCLSSIPERRGIIERGAESRAFIQRP